MWVLRVYSMGFEKTPFISTTISMNRSCIIIDQLFVGFSGKLYKPFRQASLLWPIKSRGSMQMRQVGFSG